MWKKKTEIKAGEKERKKKRFEEGEKDSKIVDGGSKGERVGDDWIHKEMDTGDNGKVVKNGGEDKRENEVVNGEVTGYDKKRGVEEG